MLLLEKQNSSHFLLVEIKLCIKKTNIFLAKFLFCKSRTVHTDSTPWTILAFKMRKWFPNKFESLYLHITSDLIEPYISNK